MGVGPEDGAVPASCRSRWKNLWLKMKATPLISSTLASAVVFLFLKLAVMAMANFPLNSFLLKPSHLHVSTATTEHQRHMIAPTWQRVPASVGSHDDVELQVIERVRLGVDLQPPAHLCTGTQ